MLNIRHTIRLTAGTLPLYFTVFYIFVANNSGTISFTCVTHCIILSTTHHYASCNFWLSFYRLRRVPRKRLDWKETFGK
jgi:hypothetical protein